MWRLSSSLHYASGMRLQTVLRRTSSTLLFVGPITTLAISPFANFDPINLIKVLFVSSIAFGLLFLLMSQANHWKSRLPWAFWAFTIFFVCWMVMVIFVSKAPIGQQFWGVFGRNNGFLTYCSLIIILVSVALIQDRRFYHKLVDVLVLTGIPVTIYALLQAAGRDPISWSVMAPFATLGNINFSSAFFGLASICSTILAFSRGQNAVIRLGLLALVLTNLFLILETGSIQGVMIYVAGVGISGFFVVRAYKPLRRLQIPYLLLGLVGFTLTSLALNNIGPLSRFVFSETVLFRFDYWLAGWAMTLNNPIFGVGLDSYGDWYREFRSEVATLRTTPDRITNTAHNIYLDISSSGGFPLLVAYLGLLACALRASFRLFMRNQSFNPYFVALFATWVAYLIQAAISINQIGVGIWGWLFTGALIGYEIATREDLPTTTERKIKIASSQLPASVALLGIVGLSMGFVLSFIPFNADAKFKDALETNSPIEQFSSAKSLGATAYHLELALDSAIKANDESLVNEIVKELLDRYPRDFMAWRVKQVLSTATEEERELAYLTLRKLDPFNPQIQRVG